MCNPVIPFALLGSMAKAAVPAFIGSVAANQLIKTNNDGDRKAQNQAQNKIDAANNAAQEQITNNQLANSVQSTTTADTVNLQQKLAAQKIPLNTTNTGLAVGNSLSTGLNLGGY